MDLAYWRQLENNLFSFICWCTSNFEFQFLQIVLEHAAPIANDMVAVDPSSTVVRSLRRNQEWKSFIFMLLAKDAEIDYEAVVKLAEVIDFGWC